MAGHSRWANIKRAKAANDAKRGKIWSKISRKLITAAKQGGGDPRDNLALRYVIDEAKAANMPRDTIERAIARGTGELGADNYEEVIYEGYAPGGVAILVEALTDNRNRTAPEMRKTFEVHGGSMATSGSVAFQFAKQGIIAIKADTIEEDRLLEIALEAGAEDVKREDEMFEVITAPADFHKVKEAIEAAGVSIESAEIANIPKMPVTVDEEQAQKLLKLLDALEDNDDVQNISHNAEIPDSITV